MNKNNYIPWAVAAGFVVSLAIAIPVFAQTGSSAPNGWGGHFGMHGGVASMTPGVFGTVSAINGTTLTVAGKTRPNATTTPTVYTVDASNAQVIKDGASSTVASIATGDMVMVQGAVSGADVTATVIRDGAVGMMGNRGFGDRPTSTKPTSTPPIQGNGEPVVGGSVAAVSGSTLTVTNASNVTYTVDASNAKIIRDGASTSIASVVTGDNVIVQGTVNGTSVAASSIIDQGSGSQSGGNKGGGAPAGASHPGSSFGFFGAIGNFFKHLFGF